VILKEVMVNCTEFVLENINNSSKLIVNYLVIMSPTHLLSHSLTVDKQNNYYLIVNVCYTNVHNVNCNNTQVFQILLQLSGSIFNMFNNTGDQGQFLISKLLALN